MQKLVWQNANGDEINLTGGNYGITEWEGFSNASLNIQNQQVPFQDGAVFLDALIEPRELSVTLKMQDKGNLETRYEMRRELIHALNPKLGEGYLIYTNDFISKRIKCIPQIPLFETHNSDTRGTPKASLAWTACEPYWEDLEDTVIYSQNVNNIVVNNCGDIKINCQIESLSDNTSSLSIKNTNNGEKIIVENTEKSLPLFVNTESGNKRVELENQQIKTILKFPEGLFENNVGNIFINSVSLIFKYNDFINYETIVANSPTDIVYYNGYYYGVYRASTTAGIKRSIDLVNWETIYSSSLRYPKIKIIDNKIFVLAQIVLYSSNGTDFTTILQNANESYTDIIKKDNNYYCLCRSSYLYRSTNLTNWTQIATQNNETQNGIAYFNNKYIIACINKLLITEDFSTWNTKNITESISSITVSDEILLVNSFAENNSVFYITKNAENWKKNELSYKAYFMFYSDFYKTFIFTDTEVLFSTTDGEQITNYGYTNNIDLTYYNTGKPKVYGNKMFVYLSYYTSPLIIDIDNNNNIKKHFLENDILDYCYNNTKKELVAIDSYKIIKETDNGWETVYNIPAGETGTIILYSNIFDCYLRVSNTGKIYESENLTDWQLLNIESVINICEDIQTQAIYCLVSNGNNVEIRKSENLESFEILQIYENINGVVFTDMVCDKKGNIIAFNNSNIKAILEYNANKNELHYWNDDSPYGESIYKSASIYKGLNIVGDNIGNIYILRNGRFYKYCKPINSAIGNLIEYNNKINITGTVFAELNPIFENCINKIEKNSNLNFGIEIGINNINVLSQGMVILTYRQKYLGV